MHSAQRIGHMLDQRVRHLQPHPVRTAAEDEVPPSELLPVTFDVLCSDIRSYKIADAGSRAFWLGEPIDCN
jgi:hypothetical protein